MKFSIEAGAFLSVLEDLTQVATDKADRRPILSHIKADVRDGKVIFFATNMESFMAREIEAKTSRPGMCTFPSKGMLSLIKAFGKDKKVTVSMTDEKRLRVSQARSRFNLTSADPHAFPNVDFPVADYMPMDSTSFIEAIDKVIHAVDPDSFVRPQLSAIMFEPAEEEGFMRAVASDGHRLATYKTIGIIPESFLIHREGLLALRKVLAKSEEFGLFIDGNTNTLVFKLEHGFFSIRLLRNNFPKYKALLPKGSYVDLPYEREDMLEALKTSLLFSDKRGTAIDFKVDHAKKTLTLTSRSDQGDAENSISLSQSSKPHADISFRLNGKFLEQLLAKMESSKVSMRYYADLRPLVFLDNDKMMSIIMPLKQ